MFEPKSLLRLACAVTLTASLAYARDLTGVQGARSNTSTAQAIADAVADVGSAAAVLASGSMSAGYGAAWLCGALDQDVKGTDIAVSEETIKADCRRKCDAQRDCTFITYGYKAPYKLRCVLKKNWNNGPDGSTGTSEGITFCCNQLAEPGRCKL